MTNYKGQLFPSVQTLLNRRTRERRAEFIRSLPSEKEEDDSQGAARSSDLDFAHFLDFALGSAFEVETQLKIAKNVGYFDYLDENLDIDYQKLMDRIHNIERQLNALISSVRKS